MKTLKIILLAVGILSLNSAFSYTALNLPNDHLTSLKAKNFVSFDYTAETIDIVVPDNTNIASALYKDTILIDLANSSTVGPFPSASKDCIMSQIPYPDFAREDEIEGGVTVRFMFDDSGAVRVLESCSNSPELEAYVCSKMSGLQLKNCVVDVNKDYYLRFMFRLF